MIKCNGIDSNQICVIIVITSKNITLIHMLIHNVTFISTDHALLGHVIDVCTGNDLVCGLQCLRNGKCRSYNCLAAENQSAEICHLSNETRTSRPEDFKGNHGTTYFELMQVYISLMVIKMKQTI